MENKGNSRFTLRRVVYSDEMPAFPPPDKGRQEIQVMYLQEREPYQDPLHKQWNREANPGCYTFPLLKQEKNMILKKKKFF